ncbi:MAG: hypothetical protein ACOCV2_09325 [Persicimonas sp.]
MMNVTRCVATASCVLFLAVFANGCIFDEGFEGDPDEDSYQEKSPEEQLPGRWGAFLPDPDHRSVGVAIFLEFEDNQTLSVDVGPSRAAGAWSVSEDDDTVTIEFSGGDQEDESIELEVVYREDGTVDALQGELEVEEADGEEEPETVEIVAHRQDDTELEVDTLDGEWRAVADNERVGFVVEEGTGEYGHYDVSESFDPLVVGTPEVYRCTYQSDANAVCWALTDAQIAEGQVGGGEDTYSLSGRVELDGGAASNLFLPLFSLELEIRGEARASLEDQ